MVKSEYYGLKCGMERLKMKKQGSTKQTHRSPFSEGISDQKIWLSPGSLRSIPLIRFAADVS
jgi:hypothetical protein